MKSEVENCLLEMLAFVLVKPRRHRLACALILFLAVGQAVGQGETKPAERRTPEQIPFCADLAKGPGRFVFEDNIFADGVTGKAKGSWQRGGGKEGGALRVRLKSASGAVLRATSGGWSVPVSLAIPALVRVNVRFKVRVSGHFAPAHFVDALLTVDGTLVGYNAHESLVRIRPIEMGDKAPLETGWQEAAQDVFLSNGLHTVRLGLRADAGLAAKAWAEMLIDRVEIQPVGTVSFTGDGGFVIHAGRRDFASGSFFSRPGGGWYRVGQATTAPGEVAEWKIQPLRQSANEWEGMAETKQFRLRRTIRVSGHRVQVEDTLSNLSDQDLGWMIRNELAVPADLATTSAVHLGGDNRPNPTNYYAKILRDGERTLGVDCWRPSNPTVFVPSPAAGVGLTIEDDVMRVHGLTYWRRTAPTNLTVGFRDETFALPPGGQYTTRWAAYIIPGADKTYYDFINQVRADWKLNDLCIPGPTAGQSFISAMHKMSDEEVQARLLKSGAWAVTTSLMGWLDPKAKTDPVGKRQLGFGPGVLDPYFGRLRDTWAQDAERIHRVAPGVKVTHYFHTFLYDPQGDPESFKDSWVTRRDGIRAITDWGNLNFTPSGQVFPTPTNAVGRGMLQVLDTMIGPMNGDGIYFDEVNYPSGMGWMDFFPCTYNVWDGHSAVLNPNTFAVIQKSGYLELLAAEFKKLLFERMASHDWIILGNGEPDTGWENRLKFPRHTECRTDAYPRAYESHLYSPIALVEDTSFKHTREMLKYGVICGFVWPEVPDLAPQQNVFKSFPLTVQEIHAGWLQGHERIITIIPGVYSWHETARVKIYEFGADGLLTATREAASASGTFDIRMPQGGMAIVERIAYK